MSDRDVNQMGKNALRDEVLELRQRLTQSEQIRNQQAQLLYLLEKDEKMQIIVSDAAPAGINITSTQNPAYVAGAETTKKLYHDINAILDTLNQQAWRVDAASFSIFNALLYTDSPTWQQGLKVEQDGYNNQVTELRNLLRRIAKNNPSLYDLLAKMESFILEQASGMNDALTRAIGNQDITSLRDLAKQKPEIQDRLSQYIDQFRTDDLMRDRKIDRAAVFIGNFCSRVEQGGTKSVNLQWKACYQFLKREQMKLTGDELAAWEWFRNRNAHGLQGKELRHFEQEISRFKRIMGSSDKLTTK